MNHKRKSSLAWLLVAMTAATPAAAGYTIMDDDLFPTRAIPASVAAAQARTAQIASAPRADAPMVHRQQQGGDTYTILFRRGIWGLGEAGGNAMYELLPLMQDRNIIVTGRPDGSSNNNLATKRGEAVRQWLIRNGIPAAQIQMRTDTRPNTAIDNQYPVEITIQSPTPTIQAFNANDLRTGVSPSGVRTTVTPTSVAIVATPTTDPRIDVIRQLAQAAQAGRLEAKAALATIVELLGTNPNPAAVSSPSSVAAAPALGMGLVAAADTARPKEWLLSSDRTLKDNAAEWAKKEGYEVDWRASNYFRVGRSQTLTGDLLDTIDKATSAAGLKMEVWKKDKLIRISDRAN